MINRTCYIVSDRKASICHSRAGGNPDGGLLNHCKNWIPACAGMTDGGLLNHCKNWIPACAGMTDIGLNSRRNRFSVRHYISFSLIICLLNGFCSTCSGASIGSAYVPVGDPVYEFLEICASKGAVPISSVHSRPLTRIETGRLLMQAARNFDLLLDRVLENDLVYYLREYAPDIRRMQSAQEKPKRQVRSIVFNPEKALQSPHKHLSSVKSENFSFAFDLTARARSDFSSKSTVFRRGTGIRFFGDFGDVTGYYFRFTDNVERGRGEYFSRGDLLYDRYGYVGPLTGGVETYYDMTEAYVSASWKLVDITFGKDRVAWGAGDELLLLSGNAPSFNHLRMSFALGSKASFKYLVGKLNPYSAVGDTLYTTANGWDRVLPADKWITAHRLEYTLGERISIAVCEALIWGDRGFEPAYLNPLNFLFSAEHDGGDLDNVLLAGDLVYRFSNMGIVYTSLLLDDLKISALGKRSSSNKFGFTAGMKIFECGLDGLSSGLEYVRLQPYVYTHFFPVNRYSTWTSSLGANLRPNSDRIRFQIKYKPRRNIAFKVRIDRNRHGDTGGTLDDAYMRGTSPDVYFLTGERTQWTEIESSVSWEFLTGAVVEAGRISGEKTSFLPDRYYLGIGYRY